ncbi:MAG: hypothetical protein NTV06_05980 [candidate division Zixibacteria bacterium]|nr:hypothetical protein [candidate division Zixibacteria bacterium]
MNNGLLMVIMSTLFLSVMVVVSTAGKEAVQSYEFPIANSIKMEVVEGDITISKGDRHNILVEFVNGLRDPRVMTTTVDTLDGVLTIKEVYSKNGPGGRTDWKITLPSTMAFDKIDCLIGSGKITLTGIRSHSINCISGDIYADALESAELYLCASSNSLISRDCRISSSGEFVSADARMKIDLPYLPAKSLKAACTSNKLSLKVPSFGENFLLTLMKNSGVGKIIMPFSCMQQETLRFDKGDTYLTDRCTVKHGDGGPEVTLITGDGTIELLTGNYLRSSIERLF